MRNRVLILILCLLSINLGYAQNEDIHLHNFIMLVNRRVCDQAEKELPLITDWTRYESLPKIEIIGFQNFITQFSVYHPSADTIWHTYPFDRLFTYITHDFKQYIHTCLKQKDYIGAANTAGCLYKIASQTLDISHPFITLSLDYYARIVPSKEDAIFAYRELGHIYNTNQQFDKAISAYTNAYWLLKETNKEASEEMANTLASISFLYNTKGEYKKALPLIRQSHYIIQKIYSDSSAQYINSVYNLGVVYLQSSDIKKASPLIELALHLTKKYFPKDKERICKCHELLGNIYTTKGLYEEAETELINAIDELQNLPSPYLGGIYNRLGLLYKSLFEYNQALEEFLIAEQIYRYTLPDYHHSLQYADVLSNMAQTYIDLGHYEEAKKNLDNTARIYKELYGERHPAYANVLLTYGDFYIDFGDYKQADEYIQQAYTMMKDILPPYHSFLPPTIEHVASFYAQLGDKKKAKEYILEAIDIQEHISDSTMDYIGLLLDATEMYITCGEYQEAFPTIAKALPLIKKLVPEDSFMAVKTYFTIAQLYSHQTENDSILHEAERYYLAAIEVLDSISENKNMKLYATIYNNLSMHYATLKQYDQALKYQFMALDCIKTIAGENHPYYESSLAHIGCFYTFLKDYEKAESYSRTAVNLMKNSFIESWTFMDQQTREAYWTQSYQLIVDMMPRLTYFYHTQKPEITQWAYDTELFTKGAAVTSANIIQRSVYESQDSTLIQRWDSLRAIKQRIVAMQSVNASRKHIANLEREAETIEKSIAKTNYSIYKEQALWSITWDSVRGALKPDQVAIEYIAVPFTENSDSTLFCALLIRDTCSSPILIPLFEIYEISQLFTLTEDGDLSYQGNEYEVAQHIWSNVIPYLNKGETVFFAPIGAIHQVAIENLPLDSTHTIGDIYNLVRLTSTREIVLSHQLSSDTTATLFGGIQYGASPEDLAFVHNNTKRSSVVDLPYTLKEIEHIQSILKKKHIRSKTFAAKTATEEAFKALSGKHQNIIHIATHGFYWDEYYSTADPLERSGLLFAGANTALRGHRERLPENVEDGILTAKEIASMDLRDADLVVLSACETGRGDITAEGVFGLQRAFKLAGAQTIIMSLWKVDDEATQLLMTTFYRNWIQKKQTKRDAFRKAQNTVRKHYDKYIDWAGFILLD